MSDGASAGGTGPDWAARLGQGTPVLITGVAGFIGHALAARLLAARVPVVGLDNLNPYYDVGLKEARLATLRPLPGFRFVKSDIAEPGAVASILGETGARHVVHLAAQAGVRHSITHPHAYAEANLTGFLNVLEACRQAGSAHLVYASSSSVYGGNRQLPFRVSDAVDHPVSLYAATKKANELMAHAYSHLYGLPATGLRFFTVYGPWGRPDMAVWLFTRAILAGQPIRVFNHGQMQRDFTYIDDIVEGVARVIPTAPRPDADLADPGPGESRAPHRVFNIGNSRAERLTDLIDTLETLLGRTAVRQLEPMQPGDVEATWADVSALEAAVGFRPATPLADGLARFVDWYRDYHKV